MDLFGDYSIESASCHPSALHVPHDTIYGSDLPSPSSPRDTTTSNPTRLANVTDLVRCFNLQSLDTTMLAMDSSSLLVSDYALSSSASPRSPASSPRHWSTSSSRNSTCWRRRMQRQSNIRLLTDPAHLRSISLLVETLDADRDTTVENGHGGDLTPTLAAPLVDTDDSDSSDSGSPRSTSSADSIEKQASPFNLDSPSVTTSRRNNEVIRISGTLNDSRVHKNRSSKKTARRRS